MNATLETETPRPVDSIQLAAELKISEAEIAHLVEGYTNTNGPAQ